MNQLNYASLEACKRLVDAGIVLETEKVWYEFWDGTKPYYCLSVKNLDRTHIPAASFAELWRELPEGTIMVKEPHGISCAACFKKPESKTLPHEKPADALAELLIWVRGEKI